MKKEDVVELTSSIESTLTETATEALLTRAQSAAVQGLAGMDKTLAAGLSLCGLGTIAYNVLSEYAKTLGWPADAIVRTVAGRLRVFMEGRCDQD